MKISYIVCCFVALLTAVIEAEAKPRGITVPFKKKILRKNRSFFEKRADASVAIYNHVDVSYIITIDIGTPPQSFDVSLNTAWADTWVPGINCTSTQCPSTRFNESGSSTFKSMNTLFNDTDDSSYATGTYGTDVVSIGSISVPNQQFAIVSATDRIHKLDNENPPDPTYSNGIFGLAYPALSYSSRNKEGTYQPFVFNLYRQNLIDNPVFSIYHNSSSGWSGEISFGSIDNTKYKGDIIYFPNAVSTSVTDFSYWEIVSAGYGIANTEIGNLTFESIATKYVINVGSTLSYFPEIIAKNILLSMIGYDQEYTLTEEYYTFDCNTESNAVFQMKLVQSNDTDPVTLNIPFSDLVHPTGIIQNGTDMCKFAIAPYTDVASSVIQDYYIGDSILRSTYIVFDMGNNRTGLAISVDSNSTIGVNAALPTNAPSSQAASSAMHSKELRNSCLIVIVRLLMTLFTFA